MFHFLCASTKKEASRLAADLAIDLLKKNPEAVLGLATGSSPLDFYADLVEANKAGQISFKKVKSVNLDEYVGLAPDHDQSYAYFMHENLFDKVDILPENTHLPSGTAKDLDAECRRYHELLLEVGTPDLQVLGIGNNGHIGFNEPADVFPENTSAVTLTESTIRANSRFFSSMDEVPKMAISMGVGEILRAKKILLLAFGTAKAEILEKALFGEVTPRVPASILQTAGEVYICADDEAMAVIREKHGAIA